jgi:hypothetical protein
VHLVGFIIKKFVTMHGHMNVKFQNYEFMPSISFQKAKLLFGRGLFPIPARSPTTLNDVFLSPSRLRCAYCTVARDKHTAKFIVPYSYSSVGLYKQSY